MSFSNLNQSPSHYIKHSIQTGITFSCWQNTGVQSVHCTNIWHNAKTKPCFFWQVYMVYKYTWDHFFYTGVKKQFMFLFIILRNSFTFTHGPLAYMTNKDQICKTFVVSMYPLFLEAKILHLIKKLQFGSSISFCLQ